MENFSGRCTTVRTDLGSRICAAFNRTGLPHSMEPVMAICYLGIGAGVHPAVRNFMRLESVLGSRRAVFWAASLYAVAHIPNPVLTSLSFFGGLLFCEFFRRWRNLFPLGIIHGALGITIAASLPDRWLHHMRVGIGYLTKQHW